MKTIIDSIYLNKRGQPRNSQHWAYYRVASLGNDRDNIEVCLIEWPSFKDIDVLGDEFKAIVVNASDTGYESAHPNLCDVLKNKWNIDHETSELLGVIQRER